MHRPAINLTLTNNEEYLVVLLEPENVRNVPSCTLCGGLHRVVPRQHTTVQHTIYILLVKEYYCNKRTLYKLAENLFWRDFETGRVFLQYRQHFATARTQERCKQLNNHSYLLSKQLILCCTGPTILILLNHLFLRITRN